MKRDDGVVHPPVPVLDYGRPPLPRASWRDGPAVRFTAGAAVPVIAMLVAAALDGADMICCDAIGVVVELFVIGGSFQLGHRLCRRLRGRPRVERHWAVTVGAGLASAGTVIGAVAVADRLPGPFGAALCLLSLFAVPAAAPWGVFRDEAVGRPS